MGQLHSSQVEGVENPPPELLNQHIVERNSLVDRVLSSRALIVLFIAPAGFGKTTSMLQMQKALQEKGERTAWLTLDKSDHAPKKFLDFFHQSLQSHPTSGDLTPFGVNLAQKESVTIFFDDFELVGDTNIPSIVRDLLGQLPRGSKIIIGTRQQPNIGLAKLRAQGLVLDLGVVDLQFTQAESRELLGNFSEANIQEEEIRLLQDRTHGWPAAIALASMALAKSNPTESKNLIWGVSVTMKPIAEYLGDVVLSRQPEEICKFLLSTSIARTLDVGICSALAPDIDAQSTLDLLNKSNLFLTKVPEHPDLWRYHPLFSDFLRERLLKQTPDEFQRLHLVASGWYEAEGQAIPAIDHAITGGDYPYAVDLLKDHARRLLAEGRLRLLNRWFALIPAAALMVDPHLIACALWAITFTQGVAAARSHYKKMSDPSILEASALSAHMRTLECTWLLMEDKPNEAHDIGMNALKELPTPEDYADNILSISMAILMVQRGEREKAHHLLDNARQRLGNKSFIRMYIESTEGEQDMQDGLLRQAAARFRIALGASHHSSQAMHDLVNGNAWSGVLYAVTCYEENRLEEAERLLTAYLPVVRTMGWHEHQILTFVLLSRIARANEQYNQAETYLTELEHAGMERNLPRLTATAWLERARVDTIHGNAEAAAAALAKADLQDLWANDRKLRRLAHSNLDFQISNLRWALQFGDPRRALSEILSELSWSRSAKWPLRTMTYQILNAIGLSRLGQIKEANKLMRDVLTFAAEQGFIRRILDEGPLALKLAQQLLESEEASDENPLLIDYLRRLLDGYQVDARKTFTAEPLEHQFSELTENLTPKEMQALKLIAEGHSNNSMAEKLGVSTSTIRTHLRNINSKLDVGSRMQAVAKARKLGLL